MLWFLLLSMVGVCVEDILPISSPTLLHQTQWPQTQIQRRLWLLSQPNRTISFSLSPWSLLLRRNSSSVYWESAMRQIMELVGRPLLDMGLYPRHDDWASIQTGVPLTLQKGELSFMGIISPNYMILLLCLPWTSSLDKRTDPNSTLRPFILSDSLLWNLICSLQE